jgi:hypothetical protein
VGKQDLPGWRIWVLARLEIVLILFELVLSAVFISVGFLTGNVYFRGVGVGLIIAWVTSAIAHFYKTRVGASS